MKVSYGGQDPLCLVYFDDNGLGIPDHVEVVEIDTDTLKLSSSIIGGTMRCGPEAKMPDTVDGSSRKACEVIREFMEKAHRPIRKVPDELNPEGATR